MRSVHLHALLAGAWMTMALVIAIKTALLGNEQAVLQKQRGTDLKARTELHYQNARLSAAVDWQTSPPVLAETVRRLQLPLARPGETPAPVAVVAAERSTIAAVERRRR